MFEFRRIEAECDARGRVEWREAGDGESEPGRERYLFAVRDLGAYRTAMTAALKTLLTSLP